MANGVKNLRNLVAGSGTISTSYNTPGGRTLVFSQAQNFKEGAMIRDPSRVWTVRSGAGTTWTMSQPSGAATAGAFHTSDPSASRAKGDTGSWGPVWAPQAKFFLYVAPVDASGNPDWYPYLDSLYPENGVHPYTKDRWTGLYRVTKESATGDSTLDEAVIIPDVAERLKALDGLPAVYLP
jgi:hypothetical protein